VNTMALELSDLYGLIENGWLRSYREQQCVDKHGAPVPWYTYCAIHFLEGRLQPWMRVFEYGCGNSTLWYAARVARVDSVENDPKWAARINALCPENAAVRCTPDTGDEYVQCVAQNGGVYDIVAIDGRNRVACVRFALGHLQPAGVVVFDDAQRARYQEAYDLLAERGFRRIDFHGVVPMIPDLETTAVFYRSDNVFGI